MEDLKIYVDRLNDGQIQKFNKTLPPDFLKIDEEELLFKDSIYLQGQAYLANEHLIIYLNIETIIYLPCSICNDSFPQTITLKNICLTEPLAEIKGAVFSIASEVRESILLQVPLFTECNSGNCPERENVKKFIKNEQEASKNITYLPFADLKFIDTPSKAPDKSSMDKS